MKKLESGIITIFFVLVFIMVFYVCCNVILPWVSNEGDQRALLKSGCPELVFTNAKGWECADKYKRS